MDPTLQPLKAAFEAIRDTAMNALSQIEQSREERSMRWKCKECEYIKALYQACSFGNHWQMPPMQKHRVSTYSVR
jgi:lipopolysaccharide biosynthesis regulator YciM